MTLLEQLKENLAKDRKAANKISVSIHTVILGECERIGKELDDEAVIKVLKKLLKDTKEAFDHFSPVTKETALLEMKVIEYYLPKQLTKDEILFHLKMLKDNGSTRVKEIMNWFKCFHAGKYDGKLVNELIKEVNS